MRLYVPACGDRITLLEPWEFDLYLERRNMAFAAAMKLVDGKTDKWGVFEGVAYRSGYKRVPASLPAGTVLECDRVYVRLFSKSALETDADFDSITWKVIKDDKPARHQRFWAKLPDCYKIEYDLPSGGMYRDRVKTVKLVLES